MHTSLIMKVLLQEINCLISLFLGGCWCCTFYTTKGTSHQFTIQAGWETSPISFPLQKKILQTRSWVSANWMLLEPSSVCVESFDLSWSQTHWVVWFMETDSVRSILELLDIWFESCSLNFRRVSHLMGVSCRDLSFPTLTWISIIYSVISKSP